MIMLAAWVVSAWHRFFGHRLYYSTSCRHGQHEHCRSATALAGNAKKPGTCKWCPSRCICPCHKESQQ